MNASTIRFEILTPCFCAGADQAKAEIRAPSIRGQLRWWFRVLGGTPAEEREVFGGVHGGEPAASRVVVRVGNARPGPGDEGMLPSGVGKPMYYLFHFAKASGGGERYRSAGFLPPGSRFDLHVSARRAPLSRESLTRLDRSLTAFRRIGSLGLRQTRGLGALCDTGETLGFEAFAQWARTLSSCVEVAWAQDGGMPLFVRDWQGALEVEESLIKALRERFPAGRGGDRPTPLGRSDRRQASAVHLRPVRLDEGLLVACFYAPAVLEPPCRAADFRLRDFAFLHPFPGRRAVQPSHEKYRLAT